jgi:hypothetical protein
MGNLEIDWTTAKVDDGGLVVALSEPGSSKWRTRASTAVAALTRPGHPWGKVAVKKRGFVVAGVTEGHEDDVRHFLESIVLQANGREKARDEADADDPDARMTAAFRAFGSDADA